VKKYYFSSKHIARSAAPPPTTPFRMAGIRTRAPETKSELDGYATTVPHALCY